MYRTKRRRVEKGRMDGKGGRERIRKMEGREKEKDKQDEKEEKGRREGRTKEKCKGEERGLR